MVNTQLFITSTSCFTFQTILDAYFLGTSAPATDIVSWQQALLNNHTAKEAADEAWEDLEDLLADGLVDQLLPDLYQGQLHIGVGGQRTLDKCSSTSK